MSDKEKIELIQNILNDFWECVPQENDNLCGAYYGILTAIGTVAFLKGE